MHARIEHLLSIRDGEPVEADIAEHVAQCAACSAELRRLFAARERMQALPPMDAEPAAWERVQARLESHSVSGWRRRVGMIAASAACVVLAVVAAVAIREDGSSPNEGVVAQTERAATTPSGSLDEAHVAELVAQSQQLEGLLQKLPERPRIERVSTAATIETLEERIQWLDFHLSYAPDDGLSEDQTRRLWRERVELMDSLVKVRYAEARQASF